MTTLALTDKAIRGLPPGTVHDAACPGLQLRVGLRGGKTWEVVFYDATRARRRVRLGTFPDLGLAAARRAASEAKGSPAAVAVRKTVADLFADYKAERAGQRRAWNDVEMVWRSWGEPRLGRVRLEDLSIRHGADLIAHVARESSPNRVRATIRYLSPMLTWAAGRGMIPGNPWRGLTLPEGAGKRDRVLTPDEWGAVALWAKRAPYPWGAFVTVLMGTAQRLSEVARMEWSEVEGDLWVIPAERHKSKKRHEVALPKGLAKLIADLPRSGPFVFSTTPGKPIVPGGKVLEKIKTETGTGGWRFHDLRRTGATYIGERGVHRFTIERVLGHADHSVTAVYDRASYRGAKRAALDVLAKATAEALKKVDRKGVGDAG